LLVNEPRRTCASYMSYFAPCFFSSTVTWHTSHRASSAAQLHVILRTVLLQQHQDLRMPPHVSIKGRGLIVLIQLVHIGPGLYQRHHHVDRTVECCGRPRSDGIHHVRVRADERGKRYMGATTPAPYNLRSAQQAYTNGRCTTLAPHARHSPAVCNGRCPSALMAVMEHPFSISAIATSPCRSSLHASCLFGERE
jgi:hypothetical protein